MDKPITTHEDARALMRKLDPEIAGWCTPEKSVNMFDAAIGMAPPPKVIVELGVFAGKSLLSLALAARFNPGCMVYGVDSWRHDDCLAYHENEPEHKQWWEKQDLEHWYNETIALFKKTGLEDVVKIIREPSSACVNMWHSIDILHIDGNHSEWQSTFDVLAYVPLVRNGGYIWIDDINWASLQTAAMFMNKRCQRLQTVEEGKCSLFRKLK